MRSHLSTPLWLALFIPGLVVLPLGVASRRLLKRVRISLLVLPFFLCVLAAAAVPVRQLIQVALRWNIHFERYGDLGLQHTIPTTDVNRAIEIFGNSLLIPNAASD